MAINVEFSKRNTPSARAVSCLGITPVISFHEINFAAMITISGLRKSFPRDLR